MLDVWTIAVHPSAKALVESLAALVEDTERRQRARSGAATEALESAVAAIVGGSLKAWRKRRAVFHSRSPNAFSDSPIGFRQFKATVDGLTQQGLLEYHPGMSYALDWGDGSVLSVGKAARMRPTARLVEMAAAHGVTLEAVNHAFGREVPSAPPEVPEQVVVRRPLKEPRRRNRRSQDVPDLPVCPDDPNYQRLTEQVRSYNAFAAEHQVAGCRPPRWRRVFGPDWLLDGRWIALESGQYQGLL